MHKDFASALFLLLFLHISSVSASERMARIIGGEPADSSAWPWMAGLVYNRSISTNEVFCGASLIAKDWVLTAAHCVDDAGSASFDVIINQAHLNLDTVNGERIHVDSVLSHPLYDRDSLDNDLALIKLATPSKNSPVNVLAPFSSQDNNRVRTGFSPALPTAPRMRVRTGRFLRVIKSIAPSQSIPKLATTSYRPSCLA